MGRGVRKVSTSIGTFDRGVNNSKTKFKSVEMGINGLRANSAK